MTLDQLLEQFEKEFVTTDKEFGQRYTNGTPTMQIDWLRTNIEKMVVEAVEKTKSEDEYTEYFPNGDYARALNDLLQTLGIEK